MEEAGKDQLAAAYRLETDEALLELALSYETLTEEAQAALREEFARRGLEPPEVPAPAPRMEFERLVTIRRYRDLADAQVASSMLDSAGIRTFLRDENTVRMEWVWSNLLGGVGLQVSEADLAAAEELLDQPIPATVDVGDTQAYQQPVCPRCGSLDIHFQRIHERFGMASVLAFGFPLPIPKQAWLCKDCGAQWQDSRDYVDPDHPTGEAPR